MNIRSRQIEKAKRMIVTGKTMNKAIATAFTSQVKEMVNPQFETCFTTVTNTFLEVEKAADRACKAIFNLVPNVYI